MKDFDMPNLLVDFLLFKKRSKNIELKEGCSPHMRG